MFRFFLVGFSLFLASPGAPAIAQEDNSSVIKIYKIGDLVAAQKSFAFDAQRWPGTGVMSEDSDGIPKTAASGYGQPAMGGGYGAEGMGTGGMGGGGGMMRVDDQLPNYISPQMGGGMGGMGGYGGMGGMGLGMGNAKALSTRGIDPALHAELLQAIYTIDGEQWNNVGGPNQISPFGDTLVVHAPMTTHQKIQTLLDALRQASTADRDFKIEWVVTDAELSAQDGDKELETENLKKEATASGVVACLDRQSVSVSAGTHQNFIVGTTPVVGSGQPAYMPTTIKLMEGWLFEFRPTIRDGAAGQSTATIDVAATFSELSQPTEPIEYTDTARIDRISLESITLSGTTVGPPNQWREVATIIKDQPQSSADSVTDTSLGSLGKMRLYLRWSSSNK